MRKKGIGAALVAGFAMTFAATLMGPLSAQQSQTAPAQPAIMNQEGDAAPAAPPQPAKPARKSSKQTVAPAAQRDPNLDSEDQLSPSQMTQPMPGAVAAPSGAPAHPPAKHTATAMPAASPKPASAAAAAASRSVTCTGAFSKDSSSLALAMVFDSKNLVFTDVDVSGTKVGATILFPNDAKRRLEIWWSNPANRSGIYLILINGQSTWTAPPGLRLGLTLADLEKLNHKPFKLKGFGKDNTAIVSDWDGGALASLPNGCKSGVSVQPDPKATADAIAAFPADKEFSSSDPAIREVKPKVSEILIGYQ